MSVIYRVTHPVSGFGVFNHEPTRELGRRISRSNPKKVLPFYDDRDRVRSGCSSLADIALWFAPFWDEILKAGFILAKFEGEIIAQNGYEVLFDPRGSKCVEVLRLKNLEVVENA